MLDGQFPDIGWHLRMANNGGEIIEEVQAFRGLLCDRVMLASRNGAQVYQALGLSCRPSSSSLRSSSPDCVCHAGGPRGTCTNVNRPCKQRSGGLGDSGRAGTVGKSVRRPRTPTRRPSWPRAGTIRSARPKSCPATGCPTGGRSASRALGRGTAADPLQRLTPDRPTGGTPHHMRPPSQAHRGLPAILKCIAVSHTAAGG